MGGCGVKPENVLTPEGHALAATYAIKAAHPELPTALNVLATLPALTNGAVVALFPFEFASLQKAIWVPVQLLKEL